MNQKELVKIFRAMGNDRRFAILKYLTINKDLTVTKISEFIKLSFKSTSRHLSILLGAGLIEYKQVNLNRFYFLRSDLPKSIDGLIRTN
jgi:predicted transcriptional regulator